MDEPLEAESCGASDHGCFAWLAHFPAPQKFVVQQLRERAKWDALVEDAFEFNVATGNCVAHDPQVGERIEIARVKRLSDGDTQFFQKG